MYMQTKCVINQGNKAPPCSMCTIGITSLPAAASSTVSSRSCSRLRPAAAAAALAYPAACAAAAAAGVMLHVGSLCALLAAVAVPT